jgi:PKD repeat protein
VLASLALSAASIAGAPSCDLPRICGRLPARAAAADPGCVYLNHPPRAEIRFAPVRTADPDDDEDPQRYTLAAGASDADFDQLYYEWDFDNDGNWDLTGYGPQDAERFGLVNASFVEHRFPQPGRKTVRLRVSDFPGLPGGEGSVIATATFTVLSRGQASENHPPVASFTYSPPDPGMRETVSFNASASFDPDLEQPITRYEWDFGGTKVVENDPLTTFQFAGPGDYNVSLRVVSTPFDAGATTQTNVHVTAEAPPRARLTADNTTPPAGQLVTFDASGSFDADGDITRYFFDLDGNGVYEISQTEPTATHRYFSSGRFFARVIVADAGGQLGRADVAIQVEGGEGGPSVPQRLNRTVTAPPVPFAAQIGTKTFSVSLRNAKRKASRAEKALRSFAKARWRSALKVKADPKTRTVRATGLVLATTKGRRPRQLCLRLSSTAKPGAPATGTLRIIGGTGPGATLRGSLGFRAVQDKGGVVRAVGEARPVLGKKRALPKTCAQLAGG